MGKNLEGMRFGRLLVIKRDTTASRRWRWLCKCDCGTDKVVIGTVLLCGYTKSCGCLRRETSRRVGLRTPERFPDILNLVGRTFGRLSVVRRLPNDAYGTTRWACKCSCGREVRASGKALRAGRNAQCKSCRPKPKGGMHKGWKGGRCVEASGYVNINNGFGVKGREHTLVMEKMIGRKLVKGENVHHKNGVRDDNRPENLELWSRRQPYGQRVEDKLAHAHEMIALYDTSRWTSAHREVSWAIGVG